MRQARPRPVDDRRAVAVEPRDVHDVGRYIDDGASHVIVTVGSPFDLTALESLLAQRDAINASRNADHRRSSFDDDGERGILLRRLLPPCRV